MRRLTFHGLTVVVAVLVLLCVPSIASADGLTWSLSGVTFDDGGTASGSFVYDAATNTVSSIDIVTTAGTLLGGATYKDPDPGFATVPMDFVLVPDATLADLTGTLFLDLEFATNLTNLGGTVSLMAASFPGNEGFCDSPSCDTGTTIRKMTAGEVVSGLPVSTPEPSVLLLLGMGLVGLAGATKRRLSQA